MNFSRQISAPCPSSEKKYDLPPAQLTVQGLTPNQKRNYIPRSNANVMKANVAQTAVNQEEHPPETYMRYLSNLSTVTINNGREYRNVPEYLRQFEMSRRGTPSSTITARRRVREGELPPSPHPNTPSKPPSKFKQVFAAVASKHRLVGLRHIALALLLILYWLGGMVLFFSIEGPYERQNVEETRHALNAAFANLSRTLNIDPFELKEVYLTLMKIDDKYSGSTFYKLEERDYPMWQWTYGTAFFYSYTLFTTIGYGSISPSTDWGRAATILYSIIGFPIALVIIRDIGSVLLVYLTRGYAKIVLKMRAARGYVDESSDKPIMLNMPISLFISLCVTLLTALFVMAYDSWLGPEPGLSYFHAFYFTYISYAAIGLGDLMPTNYAHAPVVAIVIVAGFPLMRVVNRVLYVGIENGVYGTVTRVEDSIDRIAPEKDDGLDTVEENVENYPRIEVDLCAVNEEGSEDENEEDRIRNDMANNLTVRSSAEIDQSRVNQRPS